MSQRRPGCILAGANKIKIMSTENQDNQLDVSEHPLAPIQRLQTEIARNQLLEGPLFLEEAALKRDLAALSLKHFSGFSHLKNPRPYFMDLRELASRAATQYKAISEHANERAALFRQLDEAIGKLLASDECRSPESGLPAAGANKN